MSLLRWFAVGSEGNAELDKDGAACFCLGFTLGSEAILDETAVAATAADAAELDAHGVVRCACRNAGTTEDGFVNAGNRSTFDMEGPAVPPARGGVAPAACATLSHTRVDERAADACFMFRARPLATPEYADPCITGIRSGNWFRCWMVEVEKAVNLKQRRTAHLHLESI